jgi:rare lipoprotein A
VNRQRLYAAVVILPLAGCGGGKRPAVKVPPPPQVVIGGTEEGVASWYGHPYHGRATSSGEIYDMEQLTAAHRTLPFGAVVRVENLANRRDVEVRINDRGPFVDDRIIDLSRAAARRIQMLGPGTARVRLRITALPDARTAGFYSVQVGSFQNRQNADRLRQAIAPEVGTSFLQTYDSPRGRFYRVLVGREPEMSGALALLESLRMRGLKGIVLRIDASSASRL